MINKFRKFIPALILIFIVLVFQSCKEEQIKSFTFSNGLKVLYKHTNKEEIVCNIYLKGGNRLVNKEKAGLEGFLLNVMTKATKKYPRSRLEQIIDKNFFSISSSASFDFSEYKLKALAPYFNQSMDAFFDTFLAPAFKKGDIEEVRRQQIQKLMQDEMDPYTKLTIKANAHCFANHSYSIQTDGTVSSIKSISTKELKTFYKKYWVAKRMFIVFIGKTPLNVLRKKLENTIGQLQAGSYVDKPIPPLNNVIKNDMFGVEIPNMPNAHVRSNFPSVSMKSPDYAATILAGNILTDFMGTTIRTWNSIVYTPYAIGTRPFKASYGSFVLIGCSDVPKALHLIKECVTFLSEGVGKLEYRDKNGKIITDNSKHTKEALRKIPIKEILPTFKNMMVTNFYEGLRDNQAQADQLAFAEISGNGYKQFLTFFQQIEKVTPEQIESAAKKMLSVPMFWAYASNKEVNKKLAASSVKELWK